MNAVSGTRRAMKELVDGTLRVTIDVDPQHRQRFFELFSKIDMPVALAPLMADFERPATDNKTSEAAAEAVKGGALAKLAGMLCADPAFQSWLRDAQYREWDTVADGAVDATDHAARTIRLVCGVASRAQLDHDEAAAERFHKIRKGWNFIQQERARA